MSKDEDPPVGRGNPPRSTQVPPDRSGKRGGAPRRAVKPLPYDVVLGQKVMIDEGGGDGREVTLEKAFVLQMKQRALEGDMVAHQQLLWAREQIRKLFPAVDEDNIDYLEINSFLGSVNDVVLGLGMAEKRDPFGHSPTILIEPWQVESALARLSRQLTVDEQRMVWEATLTPRKVRWPDWWTERRGTGRPRANRKGPEGIFHPPCVVDSGIDESA